MFAITSVYTGLVALLFAWLSLRVSLIRMTTRTSHGDGGHSGLAKAIRVQGNCAEYAPLGLILVGLNEAQGLVPWALHLLGATLLAGRLLHAWGLGSRPQKFILRRVGMILTYAMIAAAGATLLALTLIWR